MTKCSNWNIDKVSSKTRHERKTNGEKHACMQRGWSEHLKG